MAWLNLEYPYPQRNNDPIKSVKNNVYLKNFLNISFLHNYYFYYEEK